MERPDDGREIHVLYDALLYFDWQVGQLAGGL